MESPESKPPTGNNENLSFSLRLLSWLDQRHPKGVMAAGLVMIVSIGYLGNTTGPFLSTSLLFLIPLLLITRSTGFMMGAVCSLLAAALWFANDLRSLPQIAHPVIPYWNASMRLGTFLIAVSLVSATKSLNAHLEQRVSERTRELRLQIAENRELEKSILQISDRERATVGQDLHDGLCQQLVSAAFSCNILHEKAVAMDQGLARELNRIADMIDESISQSRNLARGLYPVRLETEGLEMALRELAAATNRRTDVECSVDCPEPVPTCGHAAGIHFYRIAQEAVINSVKHSKARRINITLGQNQDKIRLTVSDDGEWTANISPNSDGMGLRIMEYRARMIGAEFTFTLGHGLESSVTCEINSKDFQS